MAASRSLQALGDQRDQMDIGWTLFAGCLVFFMQAGFSLLEAGFVRSKNSQSILIKNLLDISVGAIGWFVMGYGLAFGKDSWSEAHGGGFFGTSQFWANDKKLLTKDDVLYDDWFFQFTFCATAATIVSGALAERCKVEGYVVFSLLMSLVFYPVVVHWTWGGGFLGAKGYLDFAGSGIVHMFGGVTALIGATVLGPRRGRFDDISQINPELMPSSVLHVTLGTFILWFGWYGFNAGSTVALSGDNAMVAARCCVTTTMAAACGGLVTFSLASFRQKKYDVCGFTNGILGGLVGITAGCANVDPQVAIIIGVVAGFVVELTSAILMQLQIDDPVGAFPVHGACGVWGVIAAGLFDLNLGWWSTSSHFDAAIGPNLLGIVCIVAWAVVTTTPVFLGLKAAGLLRVSDEVEVVGLDSEFTLARGTTPQNRFSFRTQTPKADEGVELTSPIGISQSNELSKGQAV